MNNVPDPIPVLAGPPLSALNDCGCCAGVTAETPAKVTNRPGQDAVAYRVGTHSRFKHSQLARLSDKDLPALADLRTREDDDPAIALLDAWATVADVLTFYQERIANECYLRTATERRSVLELARLTGYELSPGVAANAYLAFTIDDSQGSTKRTTIDVGTRVQSVPAPGEEAQVFETVEKIEARAEWNAMKPRLSRRHPFREGNDKTGRILSTFFFEGTATGLRAGDGLLIAPENELSVVFGIVGQVTAQPEFNRAEVQIETVAPEILLSESDRRDLIEGHPKQQSRLSAVAKTFIGAQSVRGATSDRALRARAVVTRHSISSLFNNVTATAAAPPGVIAFRVRASSFGHNAVLFDALPESLQSGAFKADHWVDKMTLGNLGLKTVVNPSDDNIFLDASFPNIAKDSFVILLDQADSESKALALYRVRARLDVSVADFLLSAKVSRLTLNVLASGQDEDLTSFHVRTTTIFAQSEALSLARFPINDPVSGTGIDLGTLVAGLSPGQTIVITGELDADRGNWASEAATIATVDHSPEDSGFTTLTLTSALANAYVRETVTICANVARATHGESVPDEVLGAGDASQPNQKFSLRQAPLTYTRAQVPGGSESSLKLFVNDLEWRETPSFYGRGPNDSVFVARRDDSGTTQITLGDGVSGARPPSGQENVHASYRKGIGLGGLVKAGQLSLLLGRPQGVTEVINPLDAEGAGNPEALEQARINAPTKVLTLDRVVALQDYEDFARGFSGIAKALATWSWSGLSQGVFVTVASPGGDHSVGDDQCRKLAGTLRRWGDPFVPIRVQSCRLALFELAGRILAAPDRRPELVLAAARDALRTRFSFDARDFAQPVALSEVEATVQSVPGVAAVSISELRRLDQIGGDGRTQPLPAAAPQPGDSGESLSAELLFLDETCLENLGLMS